MILYQTVWLRLCKYLGLDVPSKEEQILTSLRNKKKKEEFKTKLLTDENMLFYISLIMSVAAVLTILSIPFVSLESPCDIFREHKYFKTFVIVSTINNNFYIVNTVVITLFILLAVLTLKTILDAIKRTKINISPWIERGKYAMPEKQIISKKETTDTEYLTQLHFEKNRNLIVNGRYYENCGGILREKKLEEYKNRIVDVPNNENDEMSYEELVMFERQYDLYVKRILFEQKQKEKNSKW